MAGPGYKWLLVKEGEEAPSSTGRPEPYDPRSAMISELGFRVLNFRFMTVHQSHQSHSILN